MTVQVDQFYTPDLLSGGGDGHQYLTLGYDSGVWSSHTAKLYCIPVPPAIFRTRWAANSKIMRQLSNTPSEQASF
jgi:hypothetical protein